MKKHLLLSLSSLVALTSLTSASLPAGAAVKKPAKAASQAAAKPPEYAKVLTGLPTNMSVQVLRCIRANVPEFGTNNVVVLQYSIKKEGPTTGPVKYYGDDAFNALDIKCRDPILLSQFQPIRGAGLQESTYSDGLNTADWKVGQNGQGYAWFKIPDRITALDIFFPKTKPIRVNIEVPK